MTFINNLNNIVLTNVTVWNYTIIQIFFNKYDFLVRLIPIELHFVRY